MSAPDFPDAPCRNHLDLFFPSTLESRKPAKAICETCPHIQPCLDHALANDEQGIWGGTTERQRRRMHTRRAA